MLPESFAVIGGDDHQRVVENATTLQLVEELTQLLVQITKTTVVAISNQGDVRRGQPELVNVDTSRRLPGHRRRSWVAARSGTAYPAEAGTREWASK